MPQTQQRPVAGRRCWYGAFHTLRTVAAIHEQRAEMLRRGVWAGRFDDLEHTIKGLSLERWLLKTLVNMETAGNQGLPIGAHAGSGPIDSGLLRIAFGQRVFADRAGLHFAVFDREAINMVERVEYTSWIREIDGRKFVGAGAFLLYGFRFFLALEREGFPESVQIEGRELNLMHHPLTIYVEINKRPSQHIQLLW